MTQTGHISIAKAAPARAMSAAAAATAMLISAQCLGEGV